MQIGNQLPGLKMRSIVVGGVSEDKVSVRRGFRGCMQVRPGLGPRDAPATARPVSSQQTTHLPTSQPSPNDLSPTQPPPPQLPGFSP